MPQFAYKAKKDDGSVVQGTVQAESERSALDSLDRMGVFPLEIQSRSEEAPAAAATPRRVSGRVRTADTALFLRQLSDLLRAGVPINRSLQTLARQTANQQLSNTITDISKDLAAGKGLHESMARFPKIFPTLHVSMVMAGETGGFLEEVLLRLSTFIEKDRELRSRILSALAYPILLILIGTAAVTFLMVFFIPRFSEIFEKLGSSLPVTTQIVMGVSYFMRDYWFLVALGVVLLIVAWMRASETDAGRRFADRWKLRLPLFGDIVKKSAVSRFTRTLGTLLKSGVPILGALSISKEAMGNRILMEDIDEASAGVKQGRSLAEILRRSRHFPVMVTDMIGVGEEAGNLDDVLINIADTYDVQVDRAVRIFVSLLEPLLLVFMALIVGFIVISMLLPVFDISGAIK